MKLVLWGLVIFAVVMWLSRSKKTPPSGDDARSHARPNLQSAEPMVRCAHCGIHFPASESVGGPPGAVFCSEEHRRLHAAR
jgi:uncharacterized protein